MGTLDTDPEKAIMQLLENEPDFAYYNLDRDETKTIKEYWETPTLGGGALTSNMKMNQFSKEIKLPLVNLINTTKNFGYYHFQKI